mgnify:CR=1 FL=1
MARTSRQRLQLDERRAQLLEVGLDLFTEQPYEAVGIDDIAAAAGVSKGLLYHYFGGKRAFYVACVRLSAERMVESVRPDPDLPPGVKALTALTSYLDFVEARSTVFRQILLGGGGSIDAEVARIIADTRLRLAGQVLEGTGIDAERPIFRFAARSYVGTCEAASLAWLEDPDRIDRRVVMRSLLGALHALMSAAAELDPEAGIELPDPETVTAGLALMDL